MNTDSLEAIFSPDMKRALDWVPAMIWVAGPDGDCRDVNRAWEEFTGRKEEDALGNGWLSMMHPEDAAAWKDLVVESIHSATPFTRECRLRRRDGRYRWLLKNGQPVFSDKGRCIGFVGYCTDVSEQKQVLESLDQSSRKHRSVLANLREAVGVIEGFLLTEEPAAKGHKDDRLTPRQREILHLIARGYATREIAAQLHVSVKTVESHRAQLMQRLNIHDVAGLTRYAIRTGLIASDL